MIDRLRTSLSRFTIQDWIFIVFSILWVGVIFIDYLNKQVIYGPSFRYFRYFNLFAFFFVIGSLISLYFNRLLFFKRLKFSVFNGSILVLLFIGIIWAITLSFNHYWQAPLDASHYIHMAGMALFTLGSSYLLIASCYSVGSWIRQRLINIKDDSATFVLLDIGIGFVVYTFVMMALGALAILNQMLLLGFMVFFLLLHYEASFRFVKLTLWTPIRCPKTLNFWGGLLAFFVLVYLTMNYLYTQAPFPLGFDARNLYVNISKLVADAEALVMGFQPYAWSLVMSTGYIAFDSPEITLFISSIGGILALFAIYDFTHRYLKVSATMSMLVVMLFLVSPSVTNHWMVEFKVDLALVFFQMITLNLVMWWIFENKKERKSIALLDNRQDYQIVILIGVLLGYGLSIKVLSIFLVFGLFLAFWYYQRDIVGLLSLALLGFGMIILARLDEMSGLRSYHLSPNITAAICVGLGIIGLAYSFVKSRDRFLSSLKPILICTLVMSLTFAPWVYKNYAYTKSFSIMKLVLGEKPSPNVNARDIIQNYNASKKKKENQ